LAKETIPAHFVSKLTDADAEASETTIWLDFALKCGYTDVQTHKSIFSDYDQIGKMLGSMISAAEKFCYALKSDQSELQSPICSLQTVICLLPTVVSKLPSACC